VDSEPERRSTEEMREYFDESMETMTSSERREHYRRKIKELVAYACINSPFIRRHLDEAHIDPETIRGPEDLPKIPVIKKEAVREAHRISPPFGNILAVPEEELGRIYMSPGPIYDPEHRQEIRFKESKALFGAGLRPGDRVMVTFSFHLVPAGILFDTALRGMGATVVPSGVGNTELQATLLKDLRVTGYIGTASFLMSLIRRCEEMGYSFGKEIVLKRAILTGEKVPDSMRESFEREYGIETGQVYGTADLGLFAYECEKHAGMHVCEEVFLEIVDPKNGIPVRTGEVGEIVVTYFDKTLPMIRYGTGDLSFLETGVCPCGRTSHRLGGIVGRVGDSYKVRGMFIHEPQARTVLEKVEGINKGVLVISRANQRDHLAFRVELANEKSNKNEITESLRKYFMEVCRLKLDEVEFCAVGALSCDEKALVDKRVWD
jgi:phenylacetate-CoA ligase